MDPSRLIGRGRNGTAFDLSVGSTMESHLRSGMALKELPGHCVALLDTKAAAEPAKRDATAREKDFIVYYNFLSKREA